MRFIIVGVLVAGGSLSCARTAHPDDVAKFPPELVKFVPLREQPAFTGGGKDAWDESIRERGWILREGDVWKMWYTGYIRGKSKIMMLGLATSPDGITWTRHSKNPIHQANWVEDMMVVKHDGKYLMFAEGQGDQAQLLTSDNGVDWTRVGPLDVRKKNGEPIAAGPYGTPTVWFENGVWHLFYERSDLGIWLATSKDMKVWTNVQDEPVIGVGPGDWEKDLVAMNQIVKHKDRYYAYYHGSARSGPCKGLWSTGVATSRDLIHWEKYAGNPLQPTEQNKSSAILVHDGNRFRMYTMHAVVHVHGTPEAKSETRDPKSEDGKRRE